MSDQTRDDTRAPGALRRRLTAVPRVTLVILLVLLVGVTAWTFRPSTPMRHLTAYFDRTVALYPGSEVKVLGVTVGSVDSITPEGDRVKVRLSYESRYDLPADAKAVIVSPAIVGDRYVQLTPAYVSGPTLADGAVLGLRRTASPVELDTIYKSLDQLSVALGPKGANKKGALNDLLGVAAKNLDGNGPALRQTIHDLGMLTGTLSDNKDQLFDTVDQLDRFVGMLARNDTSIRGFNHDLSQVSGVLADERHDLARALDNLGVALGSVSDFVDRNGDLLTRNVKGLTTITKTLVKQRDALDQTLRAAPLALNNLFLAYNPVSGTLDQRTNIGENVDQLLNDPSLVLCAMVEQAGNPASACQAIKSLLDTLPPIGQLPGLPGKGGSAGKPTDVEHVDPTLGGLFGGRLVMRVLRAGAAAAAMAVVLTGCDFSVSDLPLPGGPDLGDDSYSVSIEFRDVLDLVPQSVVKVDDVSVGKVEDITLDGYTADVTVRLNGSVRLPENAVATIQQTSLLGEKYIALAPPTDEKPAGSLAQGDTIPLSRSGRNPEVEEVLGALSLLLNGGGVAQLKTISTELDSALSGNESEIRDVLGQLDTFMGQLDQHKSQIVAAIRSVNALSVQIKSQQKSIIDAVDELPSALKVLDQQRTGLVRMLHGLDRLSPVAVRVIRASKANTLADLKALDPVLTKLADAGDALPDSFEALLTYPFVDAAVGSTPEEAQNLHQGDYTNLSAQVDIDLGNLPTIGLPPIPSLPIPSLPGVPGLPSAPTAPDLPGLPGLPTLPSLPLPTLPSLPTLGVPTLDLPTLDVPTLSLPTLSIPGLPPITLLRGQTVTLPNGGPTVTVLHRLDSKAGDRLARRLVRLGVAAPAACARPTGCTAADQRRAAEYAARGYDEDLALLLLQGVTG